MTYQIECGHCREVITLPDETIGKSVPCPACGGMLAVVSPVPTLPVAEEAFAFPAFKRDHQALADTKAELRAKQLHQPWPMVRRGLFVTLYAIHIALPIYVLFLYAELVIAPLSPRNFAPVISRVILFLVIAQLVPILFHAVGQLFCVSAPRSHGSRLVRASVILQVCSALALIGFPLVGLYAVALSVTLLLASYATWLTFLSQMGRTLNDPVLTRHVSSYASWFWSCLAVLVGLAAGSVLGMNAGGVEVVWLCQLAAGVIGLLLLSTYHALLKSALRGIARYAPV